MVKGSLGQQHSYLSLTLFCRHLRPSMLQQLLRRLVFDVPLLTDYCKMPLRVGDSFLHSSYSFKIPLPSCVSVSAVAARYRFTTLNRQQTSSKTNILST